MDLRAVKLHLLGTVGKAVQHGIGERPQACAPPALPRQHTVGAAERLHALLERLDESCGILVVRSV